MGTLKPAGRLSLALLSSLAWALVRAVGATTRYQVEGWEHFEDAKMAGPVILCFWHNQIFSATHFWRCRGIVVMTSRHRDGEYIARVIRKFGYGAARGSSSRGAGRALLELKRSLEEGRDVAFTVDGPQGPRYQVKPGPVWLSRKSGAPIVPFHIQPRAFWKAPSWDGFRIPHPFSPALVAIGPPLRVKGGEEDAAWEARLQREMDRLRQGAEHYWE